MPTPPGFIFQLSGTNDTLTDLCDGPIFSADGTKILFSIFNFGPLTSGNEGVYLFDLATGTQTRISTGLGTPFGISPDGTQVFFSSNDPNIIPGETNTGQGLFIKNLTTGTITHATTMDPAWAPNTASAASPDGTRILFTSTATNLIPGDTAGVGGLFLQNQATGAVSRVDTSADGAPANGWSGEASFSPDGTRVVFTSLATNLVPGTPDGFTNIYVKDLATGAIFRASTDAAGAPGIAPPPYEYWVSRVPPAYYLEPASSTGASFSPDGNSLVFVSNAVNFDPVWNDTSADRLPDIFLKSLAPIPLQAELDTAHITVAEGDAGSTPIVVTVTRSGDTSIAATATWAVTGTGPHPADAADFGATTLPNGLLTFRPGETTLAVTLSVAGDTAYEPDEGFALTLRNGSDGSLLATAAGTIGNDDAFIDLAAFNVSAGAAIAPAATPYAGPVAHIERQWLATGPDNVNATAWSPNWFIHTGDGNDAIAAHSGTNVLDGGGGSNFLTGGTGADTFFLDARTPTAPIWSTLANFGAGDAATIWGIGPEDFTLDWSEGMGAPGYAGLTALASQSGTPVALLTLTGYSKADLTNGTLFSGFGHDPVSNSDYLYIARI